MIRVNSSSISSAVVMIRVLAEKARCVTIIRVNSSAKSTVDCSKAEGAICPAPPRPGSSATAGPESVVSRVDVTGSLLQAVRVIEGDHRHLEDVARFSVIEQGGGNTVFVDING